MGGSMNADNDCCLFHRAADCDGVEERLADSSYFARSQRGKGQSEMEGYSTAGF